jgi:hypothetical protein
MFPAAAGSVPPPEGRGEDPPPEAAAGGSRRGDSPPHRGGPTLFPLPIPPAPPVGGFLPGSPGRGQRIPQVRRWLANAYPIEDATLM